MAYSYHLQIYDLRFCIQSPFQLNLPDCFHPFLRVEAVPEVSDCTVAISIGSEKDRIACQGGTVQRYHLEGDEYITRVESSEHKGSFSLFFPERFVSRFSQNVNWLLYFALERQVVHFGRIFLHASAVIYQGQAYLFTAPSGTGKSTQAELWRRYCGAEILNGDKVVLRDAGENLIAYGGPVAGSSNIYVDKCAPVAAVIQLEKGTHNSIKELTNREAFLLLYKEAVKSDWDEDFNQKILTITEQMPAKTKYIHFTCLPDRTAVDSLLQWMQTQKEGNIK